MTKAVWTKFITDNAGAVVEGASVTVFLSDGITPATIFSDPAGTSKANPFLTPAGGKAEFYADPGIYVIQASKDGKTATWNNEEIGHARRDLDLSDLESAVTARNNLGLGTAATKNVTTTPTDSTPGRLLKVGDFGVGGTLAASGEVDLNIYTVGSVGQVTPSVGVVNGPDGVAVSRGIVNTYGTAVYREQLLTLTDGRMFFRRFWSTWEPWKEIYHTGNILGTVSQSGGVPTGAIIERGSNVNGEYTKFADGTLICTYTFPLVTADNMTIPGQLHNFGTWTFPAAFLTGIKPAISLCPNHNGLSAAGRQMAVSALSSANLNVGYITLEHLQSGQSLSVWINCSAIGRWF